MPDVDYFGAGPSRLPRAVLEQLGTDVAASDTSLSVLEISHRSRAYEDIEQRATTRLRNLLSIPDTHEVLFLQGGASLQFAMLPMNFVKEGTAGAYILTGHFAEKAWEEAARVGQTRVAASSKDKAYRVIPATPPGTAEATDAYLHITSNNTIVGSEWHAFPDSPVPLVADMSSDILSRPIPVGQFHMIYAGAQKNLGPAGVTIVIIRRDWVETQAATDSIPVILSYQAHLKNKSKYNTPPVFAVDAVERVLAWVEAEGGVLEMERRAKEKSALMYGVVDESDGFYEGVVDKDSRSRMNVTVRLASKALESQFLQEAQEAGFYGLSGHRSVGGIRVSLYNAVELSSCERLAEFMRSFRHKH